MLDEKGFYRKTYDDILTDLTTTAQLQYGEDINVDETSPLGKFIRIFASALDEMWQDIEGSYYTAFISTATGISLDRIATRVAMSRLLEQNATAVVEFTGTPNYTIPLGFIVGTENDVQYFTVEDVHIDEYGQGITEVMCTKPGTKGNVLEGKINVIVNPDENVISVTNVTDATGGRGKETDAEFRQRMIDSIGNTAGTTINGIEDSLRKLDDVKSVAIVENATDSPDVEGRPAHSFEVYIQGGDEQEIADTIFEKKPIGIQTYGRYESQVTDVAGGIHTIKYSRPEKKYIWVRVKAYVDNDENTYSDIYRAVPEYIGGEFLYSGIYYEGLKMGEDVIHSKLVAHLLNVEGVKDVTVELSTDQENFVAANISVGDYEIAVTDCTTIYLEVEVV